MNNPSIDARLNDLLRSDVFIIIMDLTLVCYLSIRDKEKLILKIARKSQRNSNCPVTRNILERICQFKGRRAEAVKETYELLRTGNY